MKRPSDYNQGILLTLLAAALWGFAPVATKIALQGFSPECLAFLRLFTAALLFHKLAGTGARWFVDDPWVWVAGVALGADFVMYNYGMDRTTANVAGLVINIESLATIAFAVWILGERLNVRRVVGGVITFGGVLIVTLDGLRLSDVVRDDRVVGNILVMLAGISWSLFAVAQRRMKVDEGLFQRLAPIFSIAAVISAPAMLRNGAWAVKLAVWPMIMCIVLSVFGTAFVYWIYARAQELVALSVLALFLCAMPVLTVVFAYVFLREPVTFQVAIGGAIIVAGIVVIASEKAIVRDKAMRVVAG